MTNGSTSIKLTKLVRKDLEKLSKYISNDMFGVDVCEITCNQSVAFLIKYYISKEFDKEMLPETKSEPETETETETESESETDSDSETDYTLNSDSKNRKIIEKRISNLNPDVRDKLDLDSIKRLEGIGLIAALREIDIALIEDNDNE
jgi:hypothetical protein